MFETTTWPLAVVVFLLSSPRFHLSRVRRRPRRRLLNHQQSNVIPALIIDNSRVTTTNLVDLRQLRCNQKSATKKMYFVCIERATYWLLWLSITIYALYEFALICQSQDNAYRYSAEDFKDGILSKNLYDASDFEWQSFKKLYINYWYIHLIHFVLSNIFTVYNQPTLKLTSWILITLYATYTVFSLGALLVVIINVMILILLAILGKNILSYALCFGVVLASQSTEIANKIFNPNDPRMTYDFDFEEKRFLFTYCLCFLNARGLSSALDNLTIKQKKEIQSGKDQFYEKVTVIAAYLLYLPGFFAGPIYLFNDFEKATRLVKDKPEKEGFLGSNYFKSMSNLFVLIFNIMYYEWLLHWLYSTAISNDTVLIGTYNSWQISGLVVSLCLLFYMKLTCIFGTFKVLATFDGVAGITPPLPQCPGCMHLSSQLWRKFDTGIYIWLRRYIYDPIVQSGRSMASRFLGSLVCFFCLAIWHLPFTPTLAMWIGLNIICSLVELWANAVSYTPFWSQIREHLSRPNYLRLLALIGLPMYATAVVSNLYFLSNNDQMVHEFLKRILNNTENYAIYFMIALYFGANVSLDYNRVVKSPIDLGRMHGFSCSRKGTSETSTSKAAKKTN